MIPMLIAAIIGYLIAGGTGAAVGAAVVFASIAFLVWTD